MGRWKEFTDSSVQQLWIDYYEKEMEVEMLQSMNQKLIAELAKIKKGEVNEDHK